jgi:hypothetical protein
MKIETIWNLRALLDEMEEKQATNDHESFADLEFQFHILYMKGQFAGFFQFVWRDFEKNPPTHEMMEVLAFSEKWIDIDFNPLGTRVGFVNGEGEFCSAAWIDYHDCYTESVEVTPSYWMPFPVFQKPVPKQITESDHYGKL